MDPARFTRVDPTTWRVEPSGTMRVPAIIYADENLIQDMDDKVFEQAANVAKLPGIVQASYRHAGRTLGLWLPDWRRGGVRSRSRRCDLRRRRRLRYLLWRALDAHGLSSR